MKIALLAMIGVALASPLAAQAVHEPTAVRAGSYRTDPSHTLVAFDVNHFGFSEFFGVFPRASGTMDLDPKDLSKTRLDVSVPVADVSTTNAKLDEELRGSEWFDAGKYPTIRFVSAKVTRTGERTARITGTVTMHGVSRPLVLDASFGGAGMNPLSKAYTVGFKATGHVRRSDFGVSKYVPLVGDDVTITVAAAFEKAD